MHNLAGESQQRGATVLACNVMPDHVHLFVTLPPTIALSTFIGQVKGALTYNHNKQFLSELYWQKGYGAITVRRAETDRVVRYVENQQTIHANRKASRLLEMTAPEESVSIAETHTNV